MGQYWYPVNLDKHEYIQPHRFGVGLKLWEQLANHPGTGAALIVLCAAMPKARGGGDFDLTDNWHGPERTFPEHNMSPGPMPNVYPEIARRTVGRWAGDRIALIGDYAEDGDLAPEHRAREIYHEINQCRDPDPDEPMPERRWVDVTDDVAYVIAHELRGEFIGDGWRDFKRGES